MKLKLKLLIIASLMFTGCKSSSSAEDEGSSLSEVVVQKFQQKEGMKAWSSVQIRVFNASEGSLVSLKRATLADFATGTESIGINLKYGSYKFVLEYLDKDGRTLLYKSCQDANKQDPVFAIYERKPVLKLDICPVTAAGLQEDSAGSIGEAVEVSIKPVLKDTAAAAANPSATAFFSVDAGNSLRCTKLKGAKFTEKSSLCAVVVPASVLSAGYYLKGNLRISATGKSPAINTSIRLTMSGFGLPASSRGAGSKSWTARDGGALNVNETIPVEIGKDSCLAGKTMAPQVGNVTIFVDAGGDLTVTEFVSAGIYKVACK